jgi:hypothetical protein
MFVPSVRLAVRSVTPPAAPPARVTAVLAVVCGSALAGLGLATTVLTTEPAATPPAQAAAACAQRVHAQMFFGLQGPRGPVSEAEWEAFLLEIVTPRFPDGLTVLHANGQWRSAGQPVQREASRVIEIVYDESPRARRLVDQIVAIYKQRFEQESVMVVRSMANVCF